MLLRRRIRVLATTLAVSGLLLSVGGQRAAADNPPPFIDWPSLLPGLVDEFNPSSANVCVSGGPQCIDATIEEMQRRFAALGQTCDHNAVFALAYLRTTQTYEWARDQAGYFSDTPWVNHEDAVFAKHYFNAYDDWAAGARSKVPRAWLLAFDAAAGKRVNATANLLLGMNAHVNRDLPVTLAAVGMATPDGKSRKLDHDKVNHFLNTVVQPLLAELGTRFDANIINLVTPYGVGYTGLFQTLAVWRELAWRNAELLVAAPTPAIRAAVELEIETTAAVQALALIAVNSYLPPLITSKARDSFCVGHNGHLPPLSYALGLVSPY